MPNASLQTMQQLDLNGPARQLDCSTFLSPLHTYLDLLTIPLTYMKVVFLSGELKYAVKKYIDTMCSCNALLELLQQPSHLQHSRKLLPAPFKDIEALRRPKL